MQASRQLPHPVHLAGSRRTPPPRLRISAPGGHTFTQGGSSQALHTTTLKPRSIPPMDLTPMQVLANPASPCRLVQANMQF